MKIFYILFFYFLSNFSAEKKIDKRFVVKKISFSLIGEFFNKYEQLENFIRKNEISFKEIKKIPDPVIGNTLCHLSLIYLSELFIKNKEKNLNNDMAKNILYFANIFSEFHSYENFYLDPEINKNKEKIFSKTFSKTQEEKLKKIFQSFFSLTDLLFSIKNKFNQNNLFYEIIFENFKINEFDENQFEKNYNEQIFYEDKIFSNEIKYGIQFNLATKNFLEFAENKNIFLAINSFIVNENSLNLSENNKISLISNFDGQIQKKFINDNSDFFTKIKLNLISNEKIKNYEDFLEKYFSKEKLFFFIKKASNIHHQFPFLKKNKNEFKEIVENYELVDSIEYESKNNTFGLIPFISLDKKIEENKYLISIENNNEIFKDSFEGTKFSIAVRHISPFFDENEKNNEK